MKRPRSALLLLLAAGLLLYAACRKTDSPAERPPADLTSQFFAFKSGTDPATLRVLREIQLRNSETGFVNEFARSNGLPIWDKAMVLQPSKPLPFQNVTGSPDTVLYIPLVLPGAGNTNGFIRAILNDTINISHWMAADYDEFPFSAPAGETKADEFASMLMLMDKNLFGTTTFKLLDGRLLKEPGGAVSNYQRLAKIIDIDTIPVPAICTTNVEVLHYLVQDPEHCTCPNGAASGGICADWQTGCEACSNTITVTVYTVNEGGCGGLGVTPVPTNPIGGTGGGTWNPGPIGGGGSGGIGWVPFEDEPVTTIPIDSILLRTSLFANKFSESLITLRNVRPGSEHYFLIVNNGVDSQAWHHTIGTGYEVNQNYNVWGGFQRLAGWHFHPDNDDGTPGSGPSGGDLDQMWQAKGYKNFVIYTECTNVRYALVVEDPAKINNWFRTCGISRFALNDTMFARILRDPTYSTNFQNVSVQVLLQLIGNSSTSGMGLYKSDNPDRTRFIKLN